MEKFLLQMSGKLNKHSLIKLFYVYGVFNLEKNKYKRGLKYLKSILNLI
jgi:hypothetical protein